MPTFLLHDALDIHDSLARCFEATTTTSIMPTSTGIMPTTTASPQATALNERWGRGGAGNIQKTTASTGGKDGNDETVTPSVVTRSNPTMGMTGRGGAGNWLNTVDDHVGVNIDKQKQIECQVLKNVDAELPAPPRAYASRARD